MNFPVYANIPFNSIIYTDYTRNIILILEEKYLNFDVCIIGDNSYSLNVYGEQNFSETYTHESCMQIHNYEYYEYCDNNNTFNVINKNLYGGWFIMFKFQNQNMLAKFKMLASEDNHILDIFYDNK